MSRWGSRRFLRLPVVVAGALVALIVAAVAVVATAGASAPHQVVVQRAALAPQGEDLGAPASSSAQSGSVVLKPRDQAALQTFIGKVSNPRSPEYRHYLAAGQFASRFGPTQSTISAVESTLRNAGLTVSGVSSDGLMVNFSGTTAQVDSAFSTQIERYRTTAGATGEETTKSVEVPSTISSEVSGVVGLNTLVHPNANVTTHPQSGGPSFPAAKTAKISSYPSGAPEPCTDATNAAAEYGGLTDDQIANAYGAFGLYGGGDTGSGVHIGLYELEPFATSDVETFDQCYFGDTAASSMLSRLSVVKVDGGLPAGTGSGESILDIEDLSAYAPGATINVYEAPYTGFLDEYAAMVDQDIDNIISISWGDCEQAIQEFDPGVEQAQHFLFEQGAAQGQSFFDAAGDTGADDCNDIRAVEPPPDQNPLSVEDPASDPYVVGVGGTTLQDADPANFDETVWNDGAQWGGGGGGISEAYEAPSWQQTAPGFPEPGGSVYNNANTLEASGEAGEQWPTGFCANDTAEGLSTSTPCRTVPDVSADADEFTGAVTVYSATDDGGWSTIGGTSSAAPTWAAMLALVDSSPTCQNNGVSNVGFVSPLLYAVAGNATAYAESFHDITVGDNDIDGFDNGESYPAGPGYDAASGLGSPSLTGASGGPGLAANLCALAAGTTPHPAVSGLSPSAGPVAGGGPLTVSGSGFEPGGGVTVASVTIGTDVIPAADLTVTSDSALTVNTLPPASTSVAPVESGGSSGEQDGAGPANVVVTMSNGVSSLLGPDSQYSYYDTGTAGASVPSVTSMSPFGGLESGGSTITIYGNGFTSTGDTVTFGGVPATSYTYVSPYEIQVPAPKYSSTDTDCVTSAAITAETAALGQNNNNGDPDPAADDICQTNVQVTNAAGSSANDTILPAYEGPLTDTNDDGDIVVPPGYEGFPQPDEFDYVPKPTITSVSTSEGPGFEADQYGDSLVEVTGTGLNLLTLNWFNFGPANDSSSQFTELYSDTGTDVLLIAPATPTAQADEATDTNVGPGPVDESLSALTIGGLSNTNVDATYSGIPTVTGVTSAAGSDQGTAVAPDTGGTGLTITGQGFDDAYGPIEFIDSEIDSLGIIPSVGTQYTYTTDSDTSISTQTLSENPAIVDTTVCTTSGCSSPSDADEVTLYPPGNPVLTGISTDSGPAAGGTQVTITGENLGCVTGVYFGSAAAETFSNDAAILDCGDSNSITVTSPPGEVGQDVPITVTTVESDATGFGASAATSAADFTYTANPKPPTAYGPDSVSFGSVPVGAITGASTITIGNSGASALDIGQATIAGAGARDFAISGDQCSNTDVDAGASCTIEVEFTPLTGGDLSATLLVPSNDPNSPDGVILTGTGVLPTTSTTVTTPATTVTTPPVTTTTPVTTVVTPPTSTTVTTTTTSVCQTYPHTKRVRVKVKVKGHTVRRWKTVHYTTKTCKTVTSTKRSSARHR